MDDYATVDGEWRTLGRSVRSSSRVRSRTFHVPPTSTGRADRPVHAGVEARVASRPLVAGRPTPHYERPGYLSSVRAVQHGQCAGTPALRRSLVCVGSLKVVGRVWVCSLDPVVGNGARALPSAGDV
jgi:hypothetical protein